MLWFTLTFSINLLKLGCGLNQISEKSVLRQIIEVFSDVPNHFRLISILRPQTDKFE